MLSLTSLGSLLVMQCLPAFASDLRGMTFHVHPGRTQSAVFLPCTTGKRIMDSIRFSPYHRGAWQPPGLTTAGDAPKQRVHGKAVADVVEALIGVYFDAWGCARLVVRDCWLPNRVAAYCLLLRDGIVTAGHRAAPCIAAAPFQAPWSAAAPVATTSVG